MNRLRIFFTSTLLLALLAGCVMPLNPNLKARDPIEPQAGQWGTWVLASSAELRPAAPPDTEATAAEVAQLQAMVAAIDAETEALVTYWDAGVPNYRWIELALERYAKGPPSPMVSRGMALLNVAIYDAVVASWDAKYTYNRPRPSGIQALIDMPASPSYPSEHAAAAGAAATVLAYLFPDEADFFMAQADAAGQSRLYAGVHYPSDVAVGLTIGHSVGEKVVALAQADGSDAAWTGEIPTGPDKWVGPNPVFPLAGTWQTWAIGSPDAYLPPPPPRLTQSRCRSSWQRLKRLSVFCRNP